MNAARFIAFLRRLIKDAGQKVVLIVDNLKVHHAKPVKAWAAAMRTRVPVLEMDELRGRTYSAGGSLEDVEPQPARRLTTAGDLAAPHPEQARAVEPASVLEAPLDQHALTRYLLLLYPKRRLRVGRLHGVRAQEQPLRVHRAPNPVGTEPLDGAPLQPDHRVRLCRNGIR